MNFLPYMMLTRPSATGQQLLPSTPLSVDGYRNAVDRFGDALDRPPVQMRPLRELSEQVANGVRVETVVPLVTRRELRALLREMQAPVAIDEDVMPRHFMELHATLDGRLAMFPQDDDYEPSMAAFSLSPVESDRATFGAQTMIAFRTDRMDGSPVTELQRCELVLSSPDPDATLLCRSQGCVGSCEPKVQSVPGTQDVRVVGCMCC